MNRSLQPNLTRLTERATLLRELRAFFDRRGFLEVQPPCLSRDCVVDPYIDPISIESTQLQLAIELPTRMYLQTSPESAMKRMLAAGAPSIYSLGPVFRSGEHGGLHNVEFTMLEWYEVGADLEAAVQLLGDLSSEILASDGFDVCSYRQLFQQQLGIDPIDAPIEDVIERVAAIDRPLAESIGDDRDLLLDVLLSQRIQPSLGQQRPLIIQHYPLSQAALAKPAADDPQCAARFELFYHGVELANGYDELRDPEVLAQRTQRNHDKRRAAGRPELTVESCAAESPLIGAMRQGLPACAGVALGVDRLLMVRTGDSTLSSVMPFSTANA